MPIHASRIALTAVRTLVLASALSIVAGAALAGAIRGSALYRERIALPPDAVFEAVLLDVSQAAAPRVIGRYVRDPAGQPPFPFRISYDDKVFNSNHQYALRASVTQDGRLLFSSAGLTPVNPQRPGTPQLILTRPAPSPLRGTLWRLNALNGIAIANSERQREPQLIFSASEARLSGNGGCNNFFGAFDLEGEQLRLKGLGKTMMACQLGMALETQFMAALGKTAAYRISANQLQLLAQDDSVLAQFEAAAPR